MAVTKKYNAASSKQASAEKKLTQDDRSGTLAQFQTHPEITGYQERE